MDCLVRSLRASRDMRAVLDDDAKTSALGTVGDCVLGNDSAPGIWKSSSGFVKAMDLRVRSDKVGLGFLGDRVDVVDKIICCARTSSSSTSLAGPPWNGFV